MKLKYVIMVLLLFGFVNGASAGITYDYATNIITVTGYTEASPCTFTTIYNADVAGGWGVVGRQCTNQFCFDSKLVIGDGTIITWFIDTNKHIVFADGITSSNNRFQIKINTNGTFRLGIQYLNTHATVNGCTLLSKETNRHHWLIYINGGQVDLFSCCVSSESETMQCFIGGFLSDGYVDQSSILNVYNVVSVRVQFECIAQADLYNVVISHAMYGISSISPNINNVVIQCSSVIPLQLYRMNQSCIIKNLKIEDTIGSRTIRCDIITENIYLIDCNFDRWLFYWYRPPYSNIYRQYSFNLQTTPNAKITIMNHTDIVYQGYACREGIVDEQILTMGHYTRLTGSMLNSQNPYSIEIKKRGYHTYKQKFILHDPIKWHIRLVPDRIEVGSDIIRANRR